MNRKLIRWYLVATFASVSLIGCSGPGSSSTVGDGIPNSQDVVLVANENARTLTVTDLATGFSNVSQQGLNSLANDMKLRPGTDEVWVLHSNPPSMYRYHVGNPKTYPPSYFSEYSLAIAGEDPNPWNFAFSTSGAYFYVTNWGSRSVSIYDAETSQLLTSLFVGDYPEGIEVLPNKKVVVTVTNFLASQQFGTGTVVLCDSSLFQTERSAVVGINPQVLKYYNNVLYVVCTGDYNQNTGTLWKLDANTLTALADPIMLGGYPGDLAIDVDSTGAVWGVIPSWSTGTSGPQAIQVVRLDQWLIAQTMTVDGGPSRAYTLPHGGVAVTMQASDMIFIRLRDGTYYQMRVGDGPKALLAMSK